MSRDRFKLRLGKAGNLAVASAVDGYSLPSRESNGYDEYLKVLAVEVFLGNTGGTSGQTTVDVKKNGTSILSAPLSIAQGSTTKYAIATGPGGGLVFGPDGAGEPAGVYCAPGDLLQVDVTAIPGTVSADLSVQLSCETRLT